MNEAYMGGSEVSTSVVKWSESLSNMVSNALILLLIWLFRLSIPSCSVCSFLSLCVWQYDMCAFV